MKAHLGMHFVSSTFELLFFLVSYKRESFAHVT